MTHENSLTFATCTIHNGFAAEKEAVGFGSPEHEGGQPPLERFFIVRRMVPKFLGGCVGRLTARRCLRSGLPTHTVALPFGSGMAVTKPQNEGGHHDLQ